MRWCYLSQYFLQHLTRMYPKNAILVAFTARLQHPAK